MKTLESTLEKISQVHVQLFSGAYLSLMDLKTVQRVSKQLSSLSLDAIERMATIAVLGGERELHDSDEIWDSDKDDWFRNPDAVSSLDSVERLGLISMRISDGSVLIAGGGGHEYQHCDNCTRASMQQAAGAGWQQCPSMPLTTADGKPEHLGKFCHHLCPLKDGRVLAVGGYRDFGEAGSDRSPAVDVYDTLAKEWSSCKSMSCSRVHFVAATLHDGRVIAAGGNSLLSRQRAEIFDPDTGSWSALPDMTYGRFYFGACVAPNGHFVVAGGFDIGEEEVVQGPSFEAWNPTTGEWYILPACNSIILDGNSGGWCIESVGGHLVCISSGGKKNLLYNFEMERWFDAPHALTVERKECSTLFMRQGTSNLLPYLA